MPLLTNSAEGGSTNTTVTTANSGGASGNAFDAVVIGSGATLTYWNSNVAHGALSYQIQTTATATTCEIEWTTSMGAQTQVWFRVYAMLPSIPAVTLRLVSFQITGQACAILNITTTGHFRWTTGSAGTNQSASTNAITAGSWFRVEGYVIGDPAAGAVQGQYFLTPDSVTPTETQTFTAVNTNTQPDHYNFGVSTNTANVGPYYYDDLAISNLGYIGPAIPQPPSTLYMTRTT